MDSINAFFRDPLSHSYVIMAAAFLFGTFVGSFLNVCLARMPMEKSILWPGSRCGNCLQPIHWYDNIPLVSYWRLKGQCRRCGATFSSRYFWVEFFTGVMFAALYWMECVENVRGVPPIVAKWQLLCVWLSHAVFVCFLFVAAYIDYEYMEIPLRLTIPGTIIGVIVSTLMPWPWPVDVSMVYPDHVWSQLTFGGAGLGNLDQISFLPAGAQRWPVWMPPPEWLAPGTWQMGLVTSLFGAAAGWIGIYLIRFTFTYAFGKEAMGLGDADLMMMIGAFLGWQSLIIVLVAAVFLGVAFILVQFLRNRISEVFFGPFLSAGAFLTLFAPLWFTLITDASSVFAGKKVIPWVDPMAAFQPYVFDQWSIILVSALLVVLVFIFTLVIRMMRLIGQAT